MIRNKLFDFEKSRWTHWCIYLKFPETDEEFYPDCIPRVKLMIGIWKFFLTIKLFKFKPYQSVFEKSYTHRYGITFFERQIHFHWDETKVINLPWHWEIVRHDLLLPGGSVYYSNRYPLKKKQQSFYWYEVLEGKRSPYPEYGVSVKAAEYIDIIHTLKNGTVQKAKIRLAGEEREWRWKWLRWLPWPRFIRRTVDCSSDIELGERSGSWKGGMMGWSCEWRKNETMEDAFWRWYVKWDGR